MKKNTITVYVKDRSVACYNALRRHAEFGGKAVSELVCRGMECAELEQVCSLRISPAAYFAMQDCRFDLLRKVTMPDGTSMVSITEDAYSSKDGEPGYGEKVRAYLDGHQ